MRNVTIIMVPKSKINPRLSNYSDVGLYFALQYINPNKEGILTENIMPPKRTKEPIMFVAENNPID